MYRDIGKYCLPYKVIYDKLIFNSMCSEWPYFWPLWVGGDLDFSKRDQPFGELIELREATMLEF